MKNIKNKIIVGVIALAGLSACNDFLDREPLSDIRPEKYFNTADQLSSYIYPLYDRILPTHKDWTIGTFGYDVDTDNQSRRRWSNDIWVKGFKLVPNDRGEWDFNNIRSVNYFFEKVLPKYEANEIQGGKVEVNQAIGEAYFFRAYEYYTKLITLGDFPIIKSALPDNRAVLAENSKRKPRNQVARFILEDLDKAIELLKSGPVSNKNRLSKEAALLFKSRVALYEGTWLKHHKGTAFVPGGPGWPGKQEDVDYPNGYDGEVKFFLQEAMAAAEKVTDKIITLTRNNHKIEGSEPLENPYYMMFADRDMGGYDEVLLWRYFDKTVAPAHASQVYLRLASQSGYTRGFVDAFLTKDGLPIYDSKSGAQKADNSLGTVTKNRDERLQLFMQKPGDIYSSDGKYKFTTPRFVNGTISATGYGIRKGLGGDRTPMINSSNKSENGSIVFRAAEAYLNYIEAQYELEGNVNAKSEKLWGDLRERAGVVRDYRVTVQATDMNYESDLNRPSYDWGAYSAGTPVDATLYNIRRERRCEFMAEGMRMNDLKRWKALDQVTNYQVEGIKVWGPMKSWFTRQGDLRYLPQEDPIISSPELSDYFRPYQIVEKNNRFYNGYTWTQAHYYEPVQAKEIELASPDGNPANSIIYQNPGWPSIAGLAATEVQ